MKRRHIGSTLDSLLDELGETEQLNLLAEKKSLAAELGRAMAKRNTKSACSGHAHQPNRRPYCPQPVADDGPER